MADTLTKFQSRRRTRQIVSRRKRSSRLNGMRWHNFTGKGCKPKC